MQREPAHCNKKLKDVSETTGGARVYECDKCGAFLGENPVRIATSRLDMIVIYEPPKGGAD